MQNVNAQELEAAKFPTADLLMKTGLSSSRSVNSHYAINDFIYGISAVLIYTVMGVKRVAQEDKHTALRCICVLVGCEIAMLLLIHTD